MEDRAGTLEGVEHSDRMTGAQLDFMNAQAVQGPVIEVSSEWLAVGHIDEIFVFLPRKVPLEGRPDFFAVLAFADFGALGTSITSGP